ncbi:MAG: hypothetical protein HZA94_01880 [Candidatus Vogelbacteria bacterium]|nr:hypothetical protein [Candidatus Vogelbacteria bacterium]
MYVEVAAPYPKTDLQSYINILKTPVGIRLTVNDLSTFGWRDAGLYQYTLSSGFVQVSALVQPASDKIITVNATTVPQNSGYMFAIFGR